MYTVCLYIYVNVICMYVCAGVQDIVSVHEGRYDVSVSKRQMKAIYWQQMFSIQRCSWFYRSDKDVRFQPYEEDFSVALEVSCFMACAFLTSFQVQLFSGLCSFTVE